MDPEGYATVVLPRPSSDVPATITTTSRRRPRLTGGDIHEISTADGVRVPIEGSGATGLRSDSDALAIAAHELRSPLATLCAAADLLNDHPDLISPDARALLARLQRSASWIAGLVDNLETWTALQDNRLMLDRRPISVDEWIEPALEVAHSMLARSQQRVHLFGRAPFPRVFGDPNRLGQVLVNLLTNASRYSDRADVIEVRVTANREHVCVRVTDHGPGIPLDEQSCIFDRYVRGREASRSVARGQGLGLYIVQRLVMLHRGTLGVDSFPGAGASFWFTVPLAMNDHAQDTPPCRQMNWRFAG